MKPVLIISARDNVATALEPLAAGRHIEVDARSVTAIEPIAAGHKIALEPIAAGAAVFKYGSAIGTAISDIPAGAHVHTHNVASSRGRGDLGSTAPGPDSEARPAEAAGPEPQARPAEPPDVPQTARPH